MQPSTTYTLVPHEVEVASHHAPALTSDRHPQHAAACAGDPLATHAFRPGELPNHPGELLFRRGDLMALHDEIPGGRSTTARLRVWRPPQLEVVTTP